MPASGHQADAIAWEGFGINPAAGAEQLGLYAERKSTRRRKLDSKIADTHLPDETTCGKGRVRAGSRKPFHLKCPAAAELALDSGHRAFPRGLATSPRTRPR